MTEFYTKSISDNKENEAFEIFRKVINILNEKRGKDCNKGTFGTLGCICGCYGMAGAAMLCGSAALTSGSGIVKMILPESIYPIAAGNLWEAVYAPMKQNSAGAFSAEYSDELFKAADSCTASVMGCGISVCSDTQTVIEKILLKYSKPLILDADGINCLSRNINILSKRTAQTVLTPHPGEMSRLCKMSIEEVQSDRKRIAADFAAKYNCTIVLKGVDTVISDGKRVVVNPTGNGSLAKGGSGDVLAGIIGSLVCQGITPFDAAVAGAYLHGAAADKIIESGYSMSCVNARDVINTFKFLM